MDFVLCFRDFTAVDDEAPTSRDAEMESRWFLGDLDFLKDL